MDEHLETILVLRALDTAIANRRPGAGPLHHSDQGCPSTSAAYQQRLADHGMNVSMSRRGNGHDHTYAENFWGRLTVECIYCTHSATRAAARQAIFQYTEVFYHRTRRHSALGYLSPGGNSVVRV